jgi:hypothetical protein
VPAVGDEVYEGGWLDPLMPAIYPALDARRHPAPAPGCPAFPSTDSVLTRADGDPARHTTVAPGMFTFGASLTGLGARDSGLGTPGSRIPDPGKYQVVWWDPHSLVLQAPNVSGLRRDDLIAKDGDQAGVDRRMGEYRAWQADRSAAVARASTPSIVVQTATGLAHDRATLLQGLDAAGVEVIDLPRPAGRPFGPRFGSLVHATLATVALDADEASVRLVAQTQGRILLAPAAETTAAADAVSALLAHPLFDRVRAAARAGLCSRECPVLWHAANGGLIEGTVDVVFEESGVLTILDFKTDREPSELKQQYERQLDLYCQAFAALRGRSVRGVLVRV